jgi:hypothetical protein
LYFSFYLLSVICVSISMTPNVPGVETVAFLELFPFPVIR